MLDIDRFGYEREVKEGILELAELDRAAKEATFDHPDRFTMEEVNQIQVILSLRKGELISKVRQSLSILRGK